MKAELISIGDEVLIGQVVNTNATWMAQELNAVGIDIYQITTVSDNREHILNALSEASKRADVVLITGGLGPTKDDITKFTLCEYFDTHLVFNEEIFQNIVSIFEPRGFKITDINRDQALVPASCTPLKNINGTAAGMWFEKDEVIYVSMPGVPFEMKALMTDHVIPKLKIKISGDSILHKTILTQGVGESWLAEKIASWEEELPDNTKLAYLPQPGIVRLRLSLRGKGANKLQAIATDQIEKLKSLIPDLIFGYDTDTLEQIVGDLLREKKQTLSTAESCTGGYIAHLITSIPGSSDYFTGSVVSYDNRIKEDFLDVRHQDFIVHGAVSEEVVSQMAASVRKKFKTDYAIATSGVAGPGGGTPNKPVGTTWIAIASENGVIAKKFLFGEHRGRNIRKAALQGLSMLRRNILLHNV